VKLSALFAPGKDTLAIYSFMFGPERERPCPGCTHFLDGLDGAVRHTRERFSFAVVAKSPLPRILAFADERGWRHLRLLSTAGNSYSRDYFGDSSALTPGMRKQQEFKPGEEWDMRSSTCSGATATPSATSGAASLSMCRPSPARSTATTTCSIRCGTCSTSCPRAAAISIRS